MDKWAICLNRCLLVSGSIVNPHRHKIKKKSAFERHLNTTRRFVICHRHHIFYQYLGILFKFTMKTRNKNRKKSEKLIALENFLICRKWRNATD